MKDTECWLLYVCPNEPEGWPTMVRVYLSHDQAVRDVERLNEAIAPMRDLAESFRLRVERFEEESPDRIDRWYDSPEMIAQHEVLLEVFRAFEASEGFRFEPSYHTARDDEWQPTLELKALPLMEAR